MDNRVKYQNGKFIWTYELLLNENRSILNTLIKVMVFAFLFPVTILIIVFSMESGLLHTLKTLLPLLCLIALVLSAITAISYLLICRIYNNKLTYHYEMDKDGILSMAKETDAKKTKTISDVAALTGILTKNYGLSAAAMTDHSKSYSEFKKVKSVKTEPKYDLIKVNSFLLFNQIYVNKQDYEFILDYIKMHTDKDIVSI